MKNVKFIILIFLILTSPAFTNKKNKDINYELFVNEITQSFIKESETEYGIKCGSSGGSMPYDVETISASFIVYKKSTIDESRNLELNLIKKLCHFVNSNEKIRPYLREFPFPIESAHISLSFQTQNNEFENGICHVTQARNIIFYSILDAETDSLKTIREESYSDALKILNGIHKISN